MMLMTSASVPLLPLALLVGWCKAAVPADEITKLPGWDGPLPTKHYSGCAAGPLSACPRVLLF